MNGREEYVQLYKQRVERRISENSDIMYLKDFYYFVKVKPKMTTVYNYINYVINFLRFNNITNPASLSLLHYTRYMASIDSCTQSFQIATYHALQKYSRFLAANKITDDYMVFVERPNFFETHVTAEKRQQSYLTEEEVKKIISDVMSSNKNDIWKQRDYTIILLLLASGVRCSALYKLDINDIDFVNNTMTVTEKRDSIREILLPDKVIGELKTWLAYRSTIANVKTQAVFISNQKTRMDARSLYRVSNKYGNIEGKTVHPHMFRATYGTELYKQTHDLYFTQKSMGHSNPRTTELYIRGEDDSIKERASQIMTGYFDSL